MHLLLLDAGAQETPGGAHEVAGIAGALEAHQVGAEESVNDGPAPRELGEDFRRGEGDVVEEPDFEVRACFAEHLGNQLQLVVLHPDRGSVVGVAHDGVGEPPVDLAVRIPPGPVEFRRRDDVVVERPKSGVGKALIEKFDVVRAQLHRDQVHAAVAERLDGFIRGAVPAHPCAVGFGHHRGQSGHQATGRAAPAVLAPPVLRGAAVNRKTVGHHHEVIERVSRVAAAARGFSFGACFGFFTVRSLHWCPLGS
ncbi:hypothetical protein D9M72_368110 [compost metagenome]